MHCCVLCSCHSATLQTAKPQQRWPSRRQSQAAIFTAGLTAWGLVWPGMATPFTTTHFYWPHDAPCRPHGVKPVANPAMSAPLLEAALRTGRWQLARELIEQHADAVAHTEQ